MLYQILLLFITVGLMSVVRNRKMNGELMKLELRGKWWKYGGGSEGESQPALHRQARETGVRSDGEQLPRENGRMISSVRCV